MKIQLKTNWNEPTEDSPPLELESHLANEATGVPWRWSMLRLRIGSQEAIVSHEDLERAVAALR